MKKRLKTVLILMCTALASLCFTACAGQVNRENAAADTLSATPSPSPQDEPLEESNETSEEEKAETAYERREIDPQQLQGYYDFVSETYHYMLAESENQNISYAPMGFYMSLSVLSEMTEGEAGKELQNALGYDDLNRHAEGVQTLVNSLEEVQGEWLKSGDFGRLNLDTSFWVQDTMHYQESVMNTIQKEYSLEVFEGDFQNPEFRKQMTDWVYEKTNHALQPQFEDLMGTPEDNAFGIVSTLDFFGAWMSEPFKEEDTKEGIFYCNDGTQVECEFMNFETPYHACLMGDDYISTEFSFITGESMIFILPNETQDIQDFWQGDRLSDILSAWGNGDYSAAKMKFSVPKFQCSSIIDLRRIAEKMQVTQVFDPSSDAFASFSDAPLYLTGIKQETSISIDEKGCSAAAYTAVHAQGSPGGAEEEVEICLNRPFYYIIYKDDIPFLIGIVNNPVQ